MMLLELASNIVKNILFLVGILLIVNDIFTINKGYDWGFIIIAGITIIFYIFQRFSQNHLNEVD